VKVSLLSIGTIPLLFFDGFFQWELLIEQWLVDQWFFVLGSLQLDVLGSVRGAPVGGLQTDALGGLYCPKDTSDRNSKNVWRGKE
jgi:hypothetical protein